MNLLYPSAAGLCATWLASELQLPLLSLNRTSRAKRRSQLLLGWNSTSVKEKSRCTCAVASNESNVCRRNSNRGTLEGSEECVEAIVIGSRKDSVLDFCAASPFLSPALRFWNIIGHESEHPQLQQRFYGQGTTPRIVEDLLAWESSCKAVMLVASAAYGSDHVTALEVLSNVKSKNGFAVGIILKPFRFEGQRRHDEVNNLVGILHKQTTFCVVLDTDTLLENDMVTLDEALRTSNNAVLMAMNAISILLSEKHVKILSRKDNSIRELQLLDFIAIFESHCEARIGFGAGYNVKASLLQAINECPFLGVDIKDVDGVILCLVVSSGVVSCNDADDILHTIRLLTECKGDIIVSIVHESNLEPKTILTTLIVSGETKPKVAPAPRNGILSTLGQHFPFLFNIFKGQPHQTDDYEDTFLSKSTQNSNGINSSVTKNMFNASSTYSSFEDIGALSGEMQLPLGDSDEESSALCSGERESEVSETDDGPSSYVSNYEGRTYMLWMPFFFKINSNEIYAFKRGFLTRGNLGPSHLTESSENGTNFSEVSGAVDTVSIYRVPVGVKNVEKFEGASITSNSKHGMQWRGDDIEKKQHSAVPSLSWPGLIDADFGHNGNKTNCTSKSKKQGVLAVRAQSMLESERDSEKKWNRVVEMNYRGGIYRGRAQGGLPEGKGRLLFGDGSIYDGMWRYGKRSGLGTFYFNNGDVFQGSWRDDVMHGKGWIYFHTGDRWFANFWKGKANGEGRFYSKQGYVFFGHFKEGWRHGYSLHINVDGTRFQEVWDEGVLVSEKQLDDPSIG